MMATDQKVGGSNPLAHGEKKNSGKALFYRLSTVSFFAFLSPVRYYHSTKYCLLLHKGVTKSVTKINMIIAQKCFFTKK